MDEKLTYYSKVFFTALIIFLLYLLFSPQGSIELFSPERIIRGMFIAALSSILLVSVFDSIVLCFCPVITVNAIFKSKELIQEASTNTRGGISYQYAYCLTFELEDGERVVFIDHYHKFAAVLEETKGILKYKNSSQDTKFISFIGEEEEEGDL